MSKYNEKKLNRVFERNTDGAIVRREKLVPVMGKRPVRLSYLGKEFVVLANEGQHINLKKAYKRHFESQ